MKHIKFLGIVGSLLFLLGCASYDLEQNFSGFWEGPHPDDINKKFYIQFIVKNDSTAAQGFWTFNNFYNSEFEVDSRSVKLDSIRFYVPDWDCYYEGILHDNQFIKGGFNCPGEPFDEVELIRNNDAMRFLTEAKPGCLEKDYNYRYETPVFIEKSLPTAHFQSVNDSLFIYSIISEIISELYGRLNSFLLVKNGTLICEEYFYGYTMNDLHQIESSTKSITSLLIGIARDKKMISDINEPLYQVFPSYHHLAVGEYSNITIAHLLSMTSGFSNEYEPYQTINRMEFSLQRKLIEKSGHRFIYDGGNTEILGAILKTKTGNYADVFAEKYLFSPLGIVKYDWSQLKQDSFPCMGGSLQLCPRDLAKIGLLVLNSGNFNNQQIVSAEWIKESTTFKTNTHIMGDDYGYHWWDITISSNGNNYEAIWANGLGSQFIYIIPELNVVIVTTGHNYENDSWAITGGIGKYLFLLDDRNMAW
jgi:CubicO group peptidase (beta-lactamase class C family)